MPSLPIFAVVVLAYFLGVGALLRLFTGWEIKALVTRAGVIAVVCNAPLLLGSPVGFVLYVLVSAIAMRVLIAAYDVTFAGSFFSVTAGALLSIGVAMAFG